MTKLWITCQVYKECVAHKRLSRFFFICCLNSQPETSNAITTTALSIAATASALISQPKVPHSSGRSEVSKEWTHGGERFIELKSMNSVWISLVSCTLARINGAHKTKRPSASLEGMRQLIFIPTKVRGVHHHQAIVLLASHVSRDHPQSSGNPPSRIIFLVRTNTIQVWDYEVG